MEKNKLNAIYNKLSDVLAYRAIYKSNEIYLCNELETVSPELRNIFEYLFDVRNTEKDNYYLGHHYGGGCWTQDLYGLNDRLIALELLYNYCLDNDYKEVA